MYATLCEDNNAAIGALYITRYTLTARYRRCVMLLATCTYYDMISPLCCITLRVYATLTYTAKKVILVIMPYSESIKSTTQLKMRRRN
jgi:hypothetical protein